MTRRHPKPEAQSAALPQTSRPRHAGLIAAIAITLVLGGIPFCLGRYIELHSPDPYDSSAYVYSAKHLLEGARMGVDEIPSALPGTLLVNILGVKFFGFNEFGPKIIQTILQLAAMIFMFYSVRRFFGSAAAVVSTVIAAIYLSAPLIAKGGNVKEQYLIAFAICAACGFLHYEFTGKRIWLAVTGLLAIEGYFFKPTGLAIVFAIGFYLLVKHAASRNWKALWLDYVLFMAGAAVGLIAPFTLYLWQGQHTFLKTLPVIAIETLTIMLLLSAFIYHAVRHVPKLDVAARLRTVRTRVYIVAGIVVAAALVAGIITVAAANQYYAQKYDDPSAAAGSDIISYIKQTPFVSIPHGAYRMVIGQIDRLFAASGIQGGYAGSSWALITLSELAPKVFRYYKAVCVPILTALASLIVMIIVSIKTRRRKQTLDVHTRTAWLLAAWWILDMTFVWVSPHSYEQYYLPLCASAAALACYATWQWQQKLASASFKMPWLITALVSAAVLASLSIPIFIGQRFSPDTGADYTAGGGPRRRGFAEALNRVQADQKYPWQQAGQYIRAHSAPEDTVYVWGWFPGIYVEAQRMAPVPKAYEADMHFTLPGVLEAQAVARTQAFEKNPPKFIVDSRKRHFPFNRPPLELWPVVLPGMLGNDRPRLLNPGNPQEIAAFETLYRKWLGDNKLADEALRFDAMKPMREYVMKHYRFAGQYGEHMLFERKP